jgi:hypothetical protein
MLFETDIQDFVKPELAHDEQLVTVSWKKRSSNVRIREALQGCAALSFFIFLIVMVHSSKGGHALPLVERLVGAAAMFAVFSLIFLIYCFSLYWTSDRRLTAVTNQRIILYDFRDKIEHLKASDLSSRKLRCRREFSLSSLKSARLLPQKDGSGLLIVEVYADHTSKHQSRPSDQLQLEVSDFNAVKAAIPICRVEQLGTFPKIENKSK